ncbi:MAG: thiamine-phosphate kinase [Alphaproteobacteria bacterium]
MDEFRIIDTIFKPLSKKGAPSFNLENDTAIYTPPEGFDLVLTKDAMIEGVHFLPGQNPATVGKRLLRSNLSDLAASGAKPVGYLLALMGGRVNEAWLKDFARGLKEDQEEFGISLFGGDTTSGAKTLCLSLTALGLVEKGKALSRFGAKPGDLIFVSGTIGDACLGLKSLKGEIEKDEFLISRFETPAPRLALGQSLPGLASACIDISDGLVGDLGHLTRASKVGAEIYLEKIPVSGGGQENLTELITAGDDYELLFSTPESSREEVEALSKNLNLSLTEIGKITAASEVVVFDKNKAKVVLEKTGYRHFR